MTALLVGYARVSTARAILEELTARQVRLGLGGSVHDPLDPVGGCCSPCWRWARSSRPT